MHNSFVIRIAGHYEAHCESCGLIGQSPTQKGKMEQKAAKHMRENGIMVHIPTIQKRGANRRNRARIAAPIRPAINVVVRRETQVAINADNAMPTTAQGWYTFAHANKLAKLGEGASRKVYALDAKRVIKIEKSVINGQAIYGNRLDMQCNSEVARWNSASDAMKEVLAAVLDSGDGWVIMERAQNTLAGLAFSRNQCATITSDFRNAFGIGDLHEHNVGYFGFGRFKVIDYAL